MQKKYVISGVIIASLLLLISVLTLCYSLFFSQPLVIGGGSVTNSVELEKENSDKIEEKKWEKINILFLGYGGGNHAGGGLADTLMLTQIFPVSQSINLLSIPRDLWIKMPFSAIKDQEKDFYSKINATLAIGNSSQQYLWREEKFKGKNGGGELAKKIVGEIVGQDIDFYVAADFEGFKKVMQIIAGKGGLKVQVPYSFVDEYYPLENEENNPCDFSEEEIEEMTQELVGFELEKKFECRYEKLEFKKGENYLQAEELLKLARSRHSGVNGGDFGRSLRQQAVLQGAKERLFSVAILPKLPDLITAASKLVKTDLEAEIIKKFLFDLGEVKNFKMKSMVLDNNNYLKDSRSANGQYILIPKLGMNVYDDISEMVASESALLIK